MPWFHEFLSAGCRASAASTQPAGRRALAAILSLALVLGAISPGVAFAREADSEGEGTAPPGAIEQGPESGEETALEELPGSELGGSEETGEGAVVEPEPLVEAEAPPPVESTESQTPGEPEVAAPPESTSPSASAPEYGPAYEPAPSAPVENEPLSAPPSASVPVQPSSPQSSPPAPVVQQEAPAAPSEAPEPAPVESPATAPEPTHHASDLAGRHRHVVRQGECLWSIAVALLPAGASNSAIASEVARLWKLNAARIGTGDPNLLYAGTELKLH
jgi:hypothetical protein